MLVLGWLPALVLASNRFDPRPEIFSLVFLAAYLAVLAQPRSAWSWEVEVRPWVERF